MVLDRKQVGEEAMTVRSRLDLLSVILELTHVSEAELLHLDAHLKHAPKNCRVLGRISPDLQGLVYRISVLRSDMDEVEEAKFVSDHFQRLCIEHNELEALFALYIRHTIPPHSNGIWPTIVIYRGFELGIPETVEYDDLCFSVQEPEESEHCIDVSPENMFYKPQLN